MCLVSIQTGRDEHGRAFIKYSAVDKAAILNPVGLLYLAKESTNFPLDYVLYCVTPRTIYPVFEIPSVNAWSMIEESARCEALKMVIE